MINSTATTLESYRYVQRKSTDINRLPVLQPSNLPSHVPVPFLWSPCVAVAMTYCTLEDRSRELPPMSPSLTIASVAGTGTLPTCSPNLMPFHIQYSGNAPISTYMVVKPTSSRVGAPDETTEDLTTVGTPDTTTISMVPTEATTPASSSWRRVAHTAAARFVSAFRGRTLHGLRVDVPKGYVGIVLRASGQERVTQKRQTRRGGRSLRREEEEDVEMSGELEESEPSRVLMPTDQFSSFVLWHPDNPVDEGKDEYLRSVTEWTKLASLVSPMHVKTVNGRRVSDPRWSRYTK